VPRSITAAIADENSGHASNSVQLMRPIFDFIVHSFKRGRRTPEKYFLQRVEIEQFSTERLFLGDSTVVVS
jgi:hypothetical protein